MSLGEWIAPAFRLGGSLLNGIASFILPPRLEIVQSKAGYGRLKFGGVRADQHIVRVPLMFLNESQRPVLVRNVKVKLGTIVLDPLEIPGRSFPAFLGSKGWDHINPTDSVYDGPFTIPAASVADRYAFFRLPSDFKPEMQFLDLTATVDFARRRNTEKSFTVKW